MTNPTREDIIDANRALAALVRVALSNTSDPDEKDWIKTKGRAIAAVLPPIPRRTMAEVEWDNDKHRFAEAENPDHGEVIMLNVSQISGKVRIFFNQYGEFYLGYASPENLTPTGRRYALTEVQE